MQSDLDLHYPQMLLMSSSVSKKLKHYINIHVPLAPMTYQEFNYLEIKKILLELEYASDMLDDMNAPGKHFLDMHVVVKLGFSSKQTSAKCLILNITATE